jgi:ATPase subunit of ABC transporter with duplicated ATPase domains
MSSLRARRLTFAWAAAALILDDVDLHLEPGWTALVGENGAGKSTLLRLLSGDLAPTAGRILRDPPGETLAYCPQEVTCCGAAITALAAAADGEARALRGRLRLDAAELGRWPGLSPGERKRWQLGAALHPRPGIMLLDEPTNHLDGEGRELLLRALRRFTGVGLLVSHDRTLLEALTRRTLRLHRGRATLLALPYGEASAAWQAELEAEWQARAEAQAVARAAAARLSEARRERDSADAARSRRRVDRKDHDARSVGARTVDGWAEARAGRTVSVLRRGLDAAERAIPEPPPPLVGRAVALGWERAPRPTLLALDVTELRAGGRLLLRDLHLRLGREARVRLTGPNGAGKSTLLQALISASTLPAERLLWLPQELRPGAGVAAIDDTRALPREARGRVLQLVAALGVAPDRLLASREPSPGEARKLMLALGLGRRAYGLVLDEPSNHLDLPSIERLEEALASYPGALLLVTHDDALAARLTNETWRIASGVVQAW